MTRYVLTETSNAEVVGIAVIVAMIAVVLVVFAWRARTELKSLRVDDQRKYHTEKAKHISKLRGRVFAFPVFALLCGVGAWAVPFNEGFIAVSFNDQQLSLEYRFQDPVVLHWSQVRNVDLVERSSRRGRLSWRLEVKARGTEYNSISVSDREERKRLEDAGKKLYAVFKRARAAEIAKPR